MGETEVIQIEKLQQQSQWTAWRFTVRITLLAGEIFDVVSGDAVKPVSAGASADAAATADANKKIAEWNKKDARAQKIIATSLGERAKIHVYQCLTSKAMWDKLHSVYEQKNESGKHLLQQKFFSFVKEKSDDIVTHISKLETIVQQLRDLGVVIDDNMVITKILMTLPDEYRYFVSAWESTAKNLQTIENLTNRLMIEESRTSTKAACEPAEAFFSRQKAGKFKRQEKKPGVCYQCGGNGHWKRDCKGKSETKKAGERRFTAKGSSSKNDGSGSDGSKGFFSGVGSAPSDAWYLDSGATDHICKHREWFSNYTKLDLQREITLANGTKTYGIGRGDIEILSYDGKRWLQRKLLGVLHVPDSYTNLFSSTKAMDKGHTCRSSSDLFELLDGNRVIATGTRSGGLFKMVFRVIYNENSMANVAVKADSLKVWHERLGHQNVAHVRNFLRQRNIEYVDKEFNCDGCAMGKQHRQSFQLREEKSKRCGQIIHADVCGPIEKSIGGAEYFVVFKDDYSHMRFVYFLKHKSEVCGRLKAFIKLSEKECGHQVKILQSDNGTEFVNDDVTRLLEEHGIRHRRTIPYTPEQNGCAEREMRTIFEAARSMLYAKELNVKLWAEAVNTAVYILNRTGTSTEKNKTPFELWHNKEASVDSFHIFGSEVYVHVPKQKRHKLDAKANKCIFVGYGENVKGIRVYNPGTNKVDVARDVRFLVDESDSVEITTVLSKEDIQESRGFQEERAPENASHSISEEVFQERAVPGGADIEENEPDNFDTAGSSSSQASGRRATQKPGTPAKITRRRNTDIDEANVLSKRLRHRLDDCIMMTAAWLDNEPTSYEEAISSENREQWEQAMTEEMESLSKNGTWQLVQRPKEQRVIDNKWVFKVKKHPNGSIDRFKARLVVRGFHQQHGIDYEETFSPVVRYNSIRTILAIAAMDRMEMQQFDVKTAFLYGDLEERVFMKQPTGFEDGTSRVCELRKSLYGLKQASRCWNQKFKSFIEEFGFSACMSDPCVFVKANERDTTILAIYVDDGMIVGNNKKNIEEVVEHLQRQFEIKKVDVGCFLGMEIDRKNDGSIIVHQSGYARRILKRFNMEDCNPVTTPGDPNQRMTKGDEAASDEAFPYRQLIGSLMYLAIATRPDICHALGVVSRYMEHPKAMHVNAAKRILRYIKGTSEFGIRYNNASVFCLNGYSDSDYAGNLDTRRSTTGYAFFIDKGIISWCSQGQKCVTLSTTEAEYVAAAEATKELVWLSRILNELMPGRLEGATLYMDNQSAIRLVKNPEYHRRTKHIDIDYHYIREKYSEGRFELEYVPSQEQLADGLTKSLSRDRFEYLRNNMNVVSVKSK